MTARSGSQTSRRAESPATAPPLDTCIAAYRKWMYLPDSGGLEISLGAAAANYGRGDPVWLLIVAPPGSGKTEIITPLASIEHARLEAIITEGGLLSGTPKRERTKESTGGLLREVGDFGLLILKDFGSILSMNRDTRAQLLAALREVYDGSWTRSLGTDGGRRLHWKGKLGLIGGCTETIDSHHAVLSAMGERFVLFRMEVDDAEQQAHSAFVHIGHEQEMREELATAVQYVIQNRDEAMLIAQPRASDRDRLVKLAQLVARSRSAVERDPYTRDITLVPGAEAPARLALQLARLNNGLRAIGSTRERAWELTVKTGVDSMPAIRLQAIRLLAAGEALTTTQVATRLNYPTNTARRVLDDLAAHQVLLRSSLGQGKADLWSASEWLSSLWQVTVPEKSEGESTAPSSFKNTSPVLTDISGKGPERGNGHPFHRGTKRCPAGYACSQPPDGSLTCCGRLRGD